MFSASSSNELITSHEERIPDLPRLSGSDESEVEEDEAIELGSEGDVREVNRPAIRRQDSCASSRGSTRDRHISSNNLEKMVDFIVKHEVPLTAPLPNIPPPVCVGEKKPTLERTGSTTTDVTDKTSDEQTDASEPGSVSSPDIRSNINATKVVIGFSPSVGPAFAHVMAATPPQAIPEPLSSTPAKLIQPKKPAKFGIGPMSSPESCSDSGKTPERRRVPAPQKIFMTSPISSDESSGNSLRPSVPTSGMKHATFNKISRSVHDSSAIVDDSDSEDEYIDESAIDDDDDSSDWEDSIEDSRKSSFDDKTMFQRINSKLNLTSRRSLITLMIEQNAQRTRRLGNSASQSTGALNSSQAGQPNTQAVTSPSKYDEASAPMKRPIRGTPLKPINEVPRTPAQPVMSTNHAHQGAASSPRTTRRNMLSTELTESLRRQLLWERHQKSSTINAVLRRRHTSHDVANLKQYPERAYTKNDDLGANSWNDYWIKEAFTGYHTQGW